MNGLGTLPTAGGGIMRAAYARALQARLDVGALLKQAGLTLRQAKNPEIRIPVRNQIKFLDAVAAALPDEFLGVHLAQAVDLRELGLLYYVLASSDRLGDALVRLARYSQIQNEGVHISYRHRSNVTVAFEYSGVARASDRHQIEYFATTLLRFCREVTDRRLMPTRVRFSHRRTTLPADIRSAFGGDVEYGARADEVVFPASAKALELVHADPYLNRLLLRHCEEIVASRRVKSGNWRSKVENAIAPLLPHGEATIANAAERLGVSQRTLARRLAAERVSFADVLTEIRSGLAKRYLRERRLRVAEVAWLLGYQETSAFSHAFKRWTGAAPKQWR